MTKVTWIPKRRGSQQLQTDHQRHPKSDHSTGLRDICATSRVAITLPNLTSWIAPMRRISCQGRMQHGRPTPAKGLLGASKATELQVTPGNLRSTPKARSRREMNSPPSVWKLELSGGVAHRVAKPPQAPTTMPQRDLRATAWHAKVM